MKDQQQDRSQPPDLGVYSVDDAIEKLGFGPFQVLVSVMAGMIWVYAAAACTQLLNA